MVYKILSLEDFIDMSYDEKLEAYYFGWRLQEEQYVTIPRQLPSHMGYLYYVPDTVKQGDTFPIMVSMSGLGSGPYDFYLTVNGETIYSYMADYDETSFSYLCKINDAPGIYTMEAWVVDSNGTKALLDSKEYTVLGSGDNDNMKNIGIGLLSVIGTIMGLGLIGVL